MRLDGRTAVLTGAASGIGRALAHRLASAGCHLALVDRDAEGVARTAREVATGTSGDTLRVSAHCLDLVDHEGIRRLPEAVLAAHPAVHLLVNNAGIAVGGTFEQVDEADFDRLMAVNFGAVVRMTRAFLPVLRASGDAARIVNLSSVFGLIAPPGQTAYAASKFAVRGFSQALAHELLGSRIGVTVVHPGGVATNIASSAKVPAGADPAQVEAARRQMASMLRMSPDDAAATIVRAIGRDRARVIVGRDARFASIVERLMPVAYWSVLARLKPPPASRGRRG